MSETPSGVAIRSATRKDIPDVLALWERARSAAARTADDPEVIGRLLDRDPDSLLIAELDGRLVGTLIAASDGWRGNMYRLAVAEDARRQGLGRRLVEEGQQRLLSKGIRRVTALVGVDDELAHSLWLGLGYEHDRGIARFVRNL